MKRVFPHRICRRFVCFAVLPVFMLLLCSAEGRGAGQGFVLDMEPMLGDGRINAIAPGGRAMTGIMDGDPIVWSRDFGAVRLIPPKDRYGMGNFISDDGRTMAGFVTSRREIPAGSGMAWPRPGFFWGDQKPLRFMNEHGVVDVVWYGLSADGRVALGYGKKPIPGAPPPDAPMEEHERFARTPEGQAARKRGFLTHSEFWFCMENGKFRQLDEMGTMGTSPYFRVLSRDGRSILLKKENVVYIVDRRTGKRRQLTFGGAAPFSSATQRLPGGSMVRPGDERNPLYRWGRLPGFSNGRLFTGRELAHAAPESPMFATWILRDFFCFIPSFDARFVLAEAWLERLDRLRIIGESRKLSVLTRLDEAGNGVVIDDGDNLMGLDISDNGRIVLYQRGTELRIWNEDMILPGDAFPRSMPLTEYLKRHGLALPEGLSPFSAVMSPDGECFFLELTAPGNENSPCRSFLVCMNPAAEPPQWKRTPRGSSENGAR